MMYAFDLISEAPNEILAWYRQMYEVPYLRHLNSLNHELREYWIACIPALRITIPEETIQ